MVISDKKKFIFIHNPKTAGESIEHALTPYASLIVSEPNNLHKKLNKHAWPLQIRNFVGKHKWITYFKFAFVRNPWERLISLYMYARKRKKGVKARTLPFNDYIKFILKRHTRFIRQTTYITHKTNQIVDFIGRFEHLHDDFTSVCKRVGISNTLKHLNKSNHHVDYAQYYTEETKKLVTDFAKKEIKLFGYTFE